MTDLEFWLGVAFAPTEHVIEMARVAEESGWHGIAVSDHLFYPRVLTTPYPYTPDGKPGWQPETPWPDPWVTIGAMAAATSTLRFMTNVYVAPARDVFSVAKAISTAAVLSEGRVAAGFGVGWSEDEFTQTGQAFSSRGKRLDEMVPALRELWRGDWSEYHGDHIDFDQVMIAPTPPEAIPIYIGGHSPAALNRAANLGDGWIGTLYSPEEAVGYATDLRERTAAAGRDADDFEIILSLLALDDQHLFHRVHEAGVTGILHAPWLLVPQDQPGDLHQRRLDAIARFGDKYIAQA